MKKIVTKYPKLWATVEPILLAFPSFYIIESRISHVDYLLNREALWT